MRHNKITETQNYISFGVSMLYAFHCELTCDTSNKRSINQIKLLLRIKKITVGT